MLHVYDVRTVKPSPGGQGRIPVLRNAEQPPGKAEGAQVRRQQQQHAPRERRVRRTGEREKKWQREPLDNVPPTADVIGSNRIRLSFVFVPSFYPPFQVC